MLASIDSGAGLPAIGLTFTLVPSARVRRGKKNPVRSFAGGLIWGLGTVAANASVIGLWL